MEAMSRILRSRRHWQIQDGPQGTLRQLRKQLAEDGCVDSQVIIAKRLLVESVDTNVPGTDWRSDTAQAVSWLTKASEYGNAEAADLLDRCLKSDTGITDQNRGEVKMCIDMTDGERAFRCSARKLFASLTPFGQEFVTIRQLRATISTQNASYHFASDSTKQFEDVDGGNHHSGGDFTDHGFSKWYQDTSVFEVRLGEDDLIEIAGRLSRGEVPRVSLIDDDATALETDCSVKDTRSSRKFMNCVVGALTAVSSTTIQVHRDLALGCLLLPLQDLQTFVMAIVVVILILSCLLPFGNLLVTSVPIVAFYASLIVMATTSVQMMRNAKQQRQFTAWTRLFLTVDDALDTGQAESNFCGHHFVPHFLRIVIALACLTCAQPFCPAQAVLASELTALSATLFVFSVVQLNVMQTSHTWHARAFFVGTALLTLLRLSGFNEPSRQSLVTDAIILHLGLELVPVAILTIVLFSAALCGLHKSFLPNLVALAWLHLTAFYLPNVTFNGLVRGFGIQVAIFVLPFVAHLIIPVLFLAIIILGSTAAPTSFWTISTMSHSGYWYVFPVVTTVSVVVVVIIRRSIWNWRKLVIGIELLSGLLLIMYLVPNIRDAVGTIGTGKTSSAPSLDWKIYSDLCHEPTTSAERTLLLEMQINCRHLSGLRVRWSGHVRSTRIIKIHNSFEEFIGLLPSSLATKVRCFYGKPYSDCGVADRRDARTCALLKLATAPLGCHLVDSDRYDFEVEVSVESQGYWTTADVALVADDSFRSFVFRLVAGDRVDFEGILEAPTTIGRRPVVRINEISCIDCVHGMGAARDESAIQSRERWFKPFRSIFNFVFYPHAEMQIDSDE